MTKSFFESAYSEDECREVLIYLGYTLLKSPSADITDPCFGKFMISDIRGLIIYGKDYKLSLKEVSRFAQYKRCRDYIL